MTEYSAQPNYRSGELSHPRPVGSVSVMPKRGPYRGLGKSAPSQWRRNFVKEWRLFRKMTVEQLATASGLGGGTVSAIENRRIGYSDESLGKMAKALKTTAGALLDVNPNQPGQTDFWALWDRASDPQRTQLAEIAKTIVVPAKPAKSD